MKYDVFSNVQTCPNKTEKCWEKIDMLYQEEIDILLGCINEMFASIGRFTNRGTIILYGQKKGGDARRIMLISLKNGDYDVESVIEGFPGRTSDVLAKESVDAVLEWPRKSAYDYEAKTQCFGEMETGIYQHDGKRVLVLNTTCGRFIASAILAFERGDGVIMESQEESVAVMKGMALVLARMRPKDLILQKAMVGFEEKMTERFESGVKNEIERYFYWHVSELVTWKWWHGLIAQEKGSVGLYFE